jgi:hypothetical protein
VKVLRKQRLITFVSLTLISSIRPKLIPEMLEAIAGGADVVVANREVSNTNNIRQNLSKLGCKLYGQ